MDHKVILQAMDKENNIHTWEYPTTKDYLIGENHIHDKNNYKFYKGRVNGVDLEYSDKSPLMRDVGDFKTYCRCNLGREYIDAEVPNEMLIKFLLGESKNKRKRVYQAVVNGESIKDFYNNGGCGLCEYRPGYITGYSFHNSKGVEISWNNENLDKCTGIVTRRQILGAIKLLIEEGKYLPNQDPNLVISQEEQLEGQMSILDFM